MKKMIRRTMELCVAVFLTAASMQLDASPPLTASNGKIAFVSNRDGNSEIYLMNADGTGQTRLTNNSFHDYYPIWSPDGRLIAFQRNKSGISSINLMKADGTYIEQVTTLNYDSSGVSWSPDGAKIAFTDGADIYTINVDGSGRVNLTNGQSSSEPTWAPDGSLIAFVRGSRIYAMKADGTNVHQITDCDEAYCAQRSPRWSRDGGRIVFSFQEDLNGNTVWGIWQVDANGSLLREIFLNPYPYSPNWSPDGTKIVFHSGWGQSYHAEISVIDPDGSGLRQITNGDSDNFEPDWQPKVRGPVPGDR